MHHRYVVREIILKYHRGEPLTDEEKAVLDAEMANLPADEVWKRIRSQVERKRAPVLRPWYVAAAVVVIAVGVYRYIDRRDKVVAPLAEAPVWRAVAPGHYHAELSGRDGVEVVDSAIGGQSAPYPVSLPDGSTVTLSYGSSIRYAKAFAERRVVLAGQAYFNVVKNDMKLFAVEIGNRTVQVLGTEFNWMHYPGVPDEITLIKGKIRLSIGPFQQELKPAERAVIHEGSPVRVRVDQLRDPGETVAWMSARPSIKFDSTDLYTVIQRLAQYYQVGFYVDPDLRTGRPIDGVINLQRPLQQNLDQIGEVIKDYAHIERKNGIIEVTD